MDLEKDGIGPKDMFGYGVLLAGLHDLPQSLAEASSRVIKRLVIDHENIYRLSEGELDNTFGYHWFLLYFWLEVWADWLAQERPGVSLPVGYSRRFTAALMAGAKVQPHSSLMGRWVFSHCEIHSGTIMKKGKKMIALDFELANIAPAFIDFGGILCQFSNMNGMGEGHRKYHGKDLRKKLAYGYLGLSEIEHLGHSSSGITCCRSRAKVGHGDEEDGKIKRMLFDMEIGYYYRCLWNMLLIHFFISSHDPEDIDKICQLMIEKIELMLLALGGSDEIQIFDTKYNPEEIVEEIINKGVYGAIRHKLSEGHEMKVNNNKKYVI